MGNSKNQRAEQKGEEMISYLDTLEAHLMDLPMLALGDSTVPQLMIGLLRRPTYAISRAHEEAIVLEHPVL